MEHRVLLTGTPLQNNIAELFMLMHFLDAGKFDDPDAFEAQFAEISQDEQVSSGVGIGGWPLDLAQTSKDGCWAAVCVVNSV